MKKIINFFAAALLLTSCEDVVDVDVTDEAPRLIVDALIRIDPNEDLTDANIKISISSSFFEDIQPAEIESMQIQGQNSGNFVPYEPVPGEPGMYRPFSAFGTPVADNKIVTSFLRDPDERYILVVRRNDQLYFGETTFAPSSPIDELIQGDNTLFDEEDTEIIINFTDPEDQANYYVVDFDFNEFLTTEDKFYNGQQFEFSYFYDTDLESGDNITVSLLGANEDFFNYMNGVLEQSQQGANGPFQTPTATIRGNFLNATGIDNIDMSDNLGRPDDFILGYFALSEVYSASITVE